MKSLYSVTNTQYDVSDDVHLRNLAMLAPVAPEQIQLAIKSSETERGLTNTVEPRFKQHQNKQEPRFKQGFCDDHFPIK